MKTCLIPRWFSAFVLFSIFSGLAIAKETYDLRRVDGIESFGGSATAQDLLAKNAFVAAAPTFKQIFEPYIKSPLPVFITPDSAWHTYHFLLEHGVKEMEQAQSERLTRFSRLLLTSAKEQAKKGAAEFREVARYAAIGLALQETNRSNLTVEDKRLIEALISGNGAVEAPIGFPLSPVTFRAQSFYTESPELTAYYHARQWYANVAFRLKNDRETQLALHLSWLIQSQPELLKLWRELTTPYDSMLALPEDATVTNYLHSAGEVLGPNFTLADLKKQEAAIFKKLRANPLLPRINDQLLGPSAYERFPELTAGFRVLPARQLPCTVCLQNSVDPKISGRFCPSGLDFFAGSSAMRSPAAVRAEENQFGKKVLEGVMKADPGPMPDSLYGESMRLLTLLQKPLPEEVPAVYRSEAWADLQLWTQLGAWAEQRHTWALHAKPAEMYMGMSETPPGVVAPYPDFFAGLAKLSRQTALVFDANTTPAEFNAKNTAAEMLKAAETLARIRTLRGREAHMEMEKSAELLNRYEHFMYVYQKKNPSAGEIPLDVLKRCAESGPANDAENQMLRLYFNNARPVPMSVHLNNLASVCDRLAQLATKQLKGEIPTSEEADWISSYGVKLADFHFYEGNSWLSPRDDFPIVSRIFGMPVTGSVFYAGVARPQALYVILPYKNRMQLYRGAVLSYREFERRASENLDDPTWQAMVTKGDAPDAPPFTRSFLDAAEPTAEQTNRLKALSFAQSDLAKPPASPPIKLKIDKKVLCRTPASPPRDSDDMMSSDDERHVIYVEAINGKMRLMYDGVPEKEHDAVDLQYISPNSKHVVYVATDADRSCAVINGVEGKRYKQIAPKRHEEPLFTFSPDSAHFAYRAVLDSGEECVVIDGVEGPPYEKIVPGTFLFSSNSQHFTYVGRTGDKGYVVKDNKVALEGDADGWDGNRRGPFLSPDGRRLACMLKRGSQWFVNIDGVDSQSWDDMGNDDESGFSPDGRHFAYSAAKDRTYRWVLDDRVFDSWSIGGVVFSPKGGNWAFAQENETGVTVFLNGKPGKTHHGSIYDLTFSPDGNRLAYHVEGRSKAAAVIYGEHEFEGVSPNLFSGIRFSPDSKHLAFSGTRGRKAIVLVDGKEYPAADDPELAGAEVTFSPDSRRWAYPAFHDGRVYWVVSGVEYGPYGAAPNPDRLEGMGFEQADLYFSPDGQHFAFRANRGQQRVLVVDGVETEIDGEWFPHSIIVYDSPTTFHLLYMDKTNIYFLQAEIERQ